MSQIIINLDDQFVSNFRSNTMINHLSDESNTTNNQEDFLNILDATKSIWQNEDGLVFQNKLCSEWEN